MFLSDNQRRVSRAAPVQITWAQWRLGWSRLLSENQEIFRWTGFPPANLKKGGNIWSCHTLLLTLWKWKEEPWSWVQRRQVLCSKPSLSKSFVGRDNGRDTWGIRNNEDHVQGKKLPGCCYLFPADQTQQRKTRLFIDHQTHSHLRQWHHWYHWFLHVEYFPILWCSDMRWIKLMRSRLLSGHFLSAHWHSAPPNQAKIPWCPSHDGSLEMMNHVQWVLQCTKVPFISMLLKWWRAIKSVVASEEAMMVINKVFFLFKHYKVLISEKFQSSTLRSTNNNNNNDGFYQLPNDLSGTSDI